jgi:exopolyphosphatase / guanosine-5'-triphosphate,3'-diphosphate pyrophosphatase
MRLTTIDIGTNTILMLIADISADGKLSTLRDEQVIPRLGKGIDAQRRITPETFDRIRRELQKYKSTAEACLTEKIVACGTSALRDAVNREEFVGFIKKNLGLEIEILSGDEEADLTYRGAVSGFLDEDNRQAFAVLDIGGGSTELSIGRGFLATKKISFDIGCVRITERILHSSPPALSALDHALIEVRTWGSSLPQLPTETQLLGVAGTVTTLAAIDVGLGSYDPNRVNGHHLTLEGIDRTFNELKTQSTSEMIHRFPQIQIGRADIILAGIIILRESLVRLGKAGITSSDRGLRHGIALRQISRETTKE